MRAAMQQRSLHFRQITAQTGFATFARARHLATMLALLPPPAHSISPASSHQPIHDLLRPYLEGCAHELCIVAGFDSFARLLRFSVQPGAAYTNTALLTAVRSAMGPRRVTAILLAHNHPCGSLAPSQADIRATRIIASLARLARITLIDHLIFAQGTFISLRSLGVF